MEEAQKRLAEFKAEMKKGFRRLALKYHPDHNPGDPEAEAKFKALMPILKEIEAIKIVPRAQPAVRQRVVWRPFTQQTGSFYPFSTTSSTSTTAATYDARRVVFIRVG